MAYRFALGCVCFAGAVEPNPPEWPSTVRVFSPDDTDIQEIVDAAFETNGGDMDHGQFSEDRYAFLFKPGSYNVDVPIGYYTQVLGLGASPTEVVFEAGSKGPWGPEGTSMVSIGSLNTFWRGAENFHTKSDYSWFGNPGMLWAVSQAAPVRSVIVDNDMVLFMYREGEQGADYASGGYVSNSQVKGTTSAGSQQQFFFRNSDFAQYAGGAWNMNFVGVEGAPESHCSNSNGGPIVTVDETPIIAEKPFISIDATGKYTLNVPSVRTKTRGPDFSTGRQVDFSGVFIADASMSASTINAKLSEGLDLVMSPGIYQLEEPLKLEKPDQVLLGLGIATLVSSNGTPVIQVGNVDGVRVGGVLLQAGPKQTEALLLWGDGSYAGDPSNPGFLQDVPMRVGGPEASGVQTDSMLKIQSGNVIGDNLWLWRADHTIDGVGIVDSNNPVKNGAIINGDDVTMYALMVEHTIEDLVQWNGERGATYFMQSELPYDVDTSFGTNGYTGYRVADDVKEHTAYGIGIYHFFRDYKVTVESAISVPSSLMPNFYSPLTVYLNGLGAVNHVINEYGAAAKKPHGRATGAIVQWYCDGQSQVSEEDELPLEQCPSSPEEVHAQASVDFVASAQCSDVSEEIRARVVGNAAGAWVDPHNAGNYKLVGSTSDYRGFHKIEIERVTGTGDPDSPVAGPFTDRIRFTLQQRGRGKHCEVTACSVSQGKSISDFSTNYCNQRNLYCGSADGCTPMMHDFSFREVDITLSPGSEGYPGASAEPELCIVPTTRVV